MIVVSDTSPLTALLAVGQADLLQKLFFEVVIPEAVEKELRRMHAELPGWLHVRRVQNLSKPKAYAQFVDAGEAEAIALAEELKADRLLIDERKGRRLAREHGVPVVGLLGIVLLAKQARMISSARELLERLDREAGIYLAEELKNQALQKIGE
jgi:predicted nucleic acid-binding protein